MGTPSLGILLHEIMKLMYHARCKDPIFIRVGTCGGIGVEGGTVVITEEAVDGLMRPVHEVVRFNHFRCDRNICNDYFVYFQPILGKLVQRPAKLDKRLARELKSLADPTLEPYDTVIGKTMCTNDFYEGKKQNYHRKKNTYLCYQHVLFLTLSFLVSLRTCHRPRTVGWSVLRFQ